MSKNGRPSIARRALTAAASCAIFVVALEGSLGAMQRFSFPYLPLFVKDAAHGVALAQNASARVRTRGGHITTVHTDGDGARVVPSSAHAAGRSLLVIGDSQAMGLHVEDEETFSALLAHTGRRVRLRAVPSYGPLEYASLVEAHARAGDDVFVLFAPSNDFFEARVENVRRTSARLGFVARVPGDGPSILDHVPGVFGRSHTVYALRMALGRAAKDAHIVDVTHLFETAGEKLVTPSAGDTHASRLGPAIARIAARCADIGCRAFAAVLPLDVESDARAFDKVARPADRPRVLDVAARLRAGAHADLRAAGVGVVDLVDALAFEGAFLDDDDHLSPRGHAALARTLEGALDARLAGLIPQEAL